MVIVEAHSRYMFTQELTKKCDTGRTLITIINKLETTVSSAHQQPLRVTKIQADWGGEFRNAPLQTEFDQRGINLKGQSIRFCSMSRTGYHTKPYKENPHRDLATKRPR